MKRGGKFIITLLCLVGIIYGFTFIRMISIDKNNPRVPQGNNIISSGKEKPLKIARKYNPTIEEAYEIGTDENTRKLSDINNIIVYDADNCSTIILYQVENTIHSAEFMSEDKKGYVYIGGMINEFSDDLRIQDKGIETTVRSDLYYCMDDSRGWLNLKKDYNRMIAWGMTDNKAIYNMKIENQSPDNIYEVEYNQKTYYLWYYKDLKTNSNARDAKITF